MAKRKITPGDEAIDNRVKSVIIPALKELATIKVCNNCDQELLRDVKFWLTQSESFVDKYLDIRHEQSVGGLRGQLVKSGIIPKQE
ncbi:MAG: hypothetical protein M0R50_11195 [Candidatus Cloacimonetes bacterium]|jgi:hypothetical protein|nr:hypothetical protein [Candidatus Cloacimonadota bacterium]